MLLDHVGHLRCETFHVIQLRLLQTGKESNLIFELESQTTPAGTIEDMKQECPFLIMPCIAMTSASVLPLAKLLILHFRS